MTTRTTSTPIMPGKMYHIYNRGNNHDKLFYQKSDYQMFVGSFVKYVAPLADVYAYCLISNHYHFLLKVKEETESRVFTNGMGSLLKSFTNNINMKYGRRGGLYQGRYRRREVNSLSYLRMLCVYIHLNPLKHGVTEDYKTYPYSSMKDYEHHRNDMVKVSTLLEAFESIENFRFVHDIAAKQKIGELLP